MCDFVGSLIKRLTRSKESRTASYFERGKLGGKSGRGLPFERAEETGNDRSLVGTLAKAETWEGVKKLELVKKKKVRRCGDIWEDHKYLISNRQLKKSRIRSRKGKNKL